MSAIKQTLFNTLKGSRNVVTGCGSGLGKATLQMFLKHGSGQVLGIDRYYEEKFEEDLGLSEDQANKLVLRAHSTFDGNVEKTLAEFSDKYGQIDNLINCAGVAQAYLLSSDTTYNMRNASNLVDFNTVGTFNMIRLASKYMIKARAKGINQTKCIINAGCFSTTSPCLGQNFYAGTKASIDSLTLCVARELAPYNIRCNTISVGLFDTKVIRDLGQQSVDYTAKISLCPRRLGDPNEFAHLVKTIIENQMLNGACIKLDAGTRLGPAF